MGDEPSYWGQKQLNQTISVLKMIEERILVWLEVKQSAPQIIKGGGNPIEVLLWSRGKSLYEVRKFLGRPNPEKFEEIKEERKNSLLDEKIDIFSKERRRSSFKIESKKQEETRQSLVKNDNERIKKIRQLVDFEENSLALSQNQKIMCGIIDEE